MLHTKVVDIKDKKLSIIDAEKFIHPLTLVHQYFFWNSKKSK